MAALRAGVPALLWCRNDGEDVWAGLGPLMNQAAPLGELPWRIFEFREAVDQGAGERHLARHLTLLWDDPGRIPDVDSPAPHARMKGEGPWLAMTECRATNGSSIAAAASRTTMQRLPGPPPWRRPREPLADMNRARTYQIDPSEVDVVDAALRLRRPLLATGMPGTGKASLAASIAHELKLGPVLTWSITSRSTLADGLYSYDAIGRLH